MLYVFDSLKKEQGHKSHSLKNQIVTMYVCDSLKKIYKKHSFRNLTTLAALKMSDSLNRLIRVFHLEVEPHWMCCTTLDVHVFDSPKRTTQSYLFRNRTALVMLYVFESAYSDHDIQYNYCNYVCYTPLG